MSQMIPAENTQKMEFDVTTAEGPSRITIVTGSFPIKVGVGRTPKSVKTLVDPTLQPGQFRKATAVVSFMNVTCSIPSSGPIDPNNSGGPGASPAWLIDDVEATLDDESSRIVLRMDIGGSTASQTHPMVGRIGFQVTTLARKCGEPDQSRVAADQDYEGQPLAEKSLVRMAPSGETTIKIWPPTIESAVATRDRTITLNVYYSEAGWDFLMFKRKNLATQITTEFQFPVGVKSTDDTYFTVDDIGQIWRDHRDPIGLDPETSYEYRVAAYYGVWGVWSIWSDPAVIGKTLNTPFEPTFEGALSYDEGGWQGYTLVQRIEPEALSKSGRQVELTVRASSPGPGTVGTYIDSIYISRADPAGQPYDSDIDLTKVSDKWLLPVDQAFTFSFRRYNLIRESPLLICVDFSLPATLKYRLVKSSPGHPPLMPPILPIGVAYWHTGLEAGLRNRSANYDSANRIYLVEKIGVR